MKQTLNYNNFHFSFDVGKKGKAIPVADRKGP
jgi:hypothetical protein